MKKKLLGAFFALVLAVSAFCGTLTTAFAAGEFSADFEGSAVYPAGRTREEITAALNKRIADENEKIQAVIDEGGNLEEAFNSGEIVAYSRRNEGIINAENKRSGYKVWEGAPLLDLKFINKGYDSWGDNSVAWLTYNGVKDEAYFITAEFANAFGNDGNQKLGIPCADMFRLDDGDGTYTAYQNFTNGYIKSDNGTTSVVNGKNVVLGEDNAISETAADPASTGYIGAASESTLNKAGVSATQFAKAFTDAYNRYAEEGFNVGYPFSPVMDEGKNSGGESRYGTLCSQNFRFGDSVSAPWGTSDDRRNWAFLAYNFEQGKVYLIADEFQRAFETTVENTGSLGDPIGDAFLAKDGNRYQNFEKGYMKAEGAEAQNANASVVLGKNVDENGNAADIDVSSKIGVLGKTVTSVPEKYTNETFSAAFKAAYEEKVEYKEGEELLGVDLVAYENGFYSQKYTDNKGAVHMLAYVEKTDEFVYLRPEVVSKYQSNTGLGKPSGAAIKVAEKSGQEIFAYPFDNGYIKLTVSEQVKIEDGKPVTVINESGVITVGAKYDAEKNFFETVSFAESITAGIVNASVSQAYEFLNIPDAETLAAAFKTAYEEAFALGFSAGEPASEGITWWTTGNSGIVKMTLKGGNGNASFWGDNTLMTYNPVDGKVYITTGDIANRYASEGASGNGWALTEMLINTATGVVVQQFDIHDTVVETRPVYFITQNGTTNKVSGTYDFEANKGSGEWVKYISQFGGSISSTPVSGLESSKVGEQISVDFSKFIVNENGYYVNYTLTSAQGSIDENGVFTYTPAEAGKITVTVEAASAFDKLTLTAEIEVKGDGNTDPVDPDPDPTDPEKEGCNGCNGAFGAGEAGAIAAIALVVAGLFMIVRRNKRED